MLALARHVWDLVLAGNETIWAAIIGVLGAIVAGAIGGLMAVWAALKGAKRAHDDNVRRDEAGRLAETIAVVQAIRSELDAEWHLCEKIFAPSVKSAGPGNPLVRSFVLEGAVFPVFEANAGLLGRIDDVATRDAIVRGYAYARMFIDSIRANNQLVAEYKRVTNATMSYEMQMAWKALDEFSSTVLDLHQNLESQYHEVMKRTADWLAQKGQPVKPPARRIAPSSAF